MTNSIKQLLRSLILATQALLLSRKSGEMSDKWMSKQLEAYEKADRKSGGLY